MSGLTNCPFCGIENTDIGFIAHTEKCYLMLRYMGGYSKKELGISWNTRPIEDKLQAEIERLTAELAELRERFMVTDDLLNHATVTIGAVIACCTYNSNEDAKIGVYGISPDAFTRIDRFITRYNRAVADGKISVDVKPVTRDLSDFEIEELGAQEAEKRGEK